MERVGFSYGDKNATIWNSQSWRRSAVRIENKASFIITANLMSQKRRISSRPSNLQIKY